MALTVPWLVAAGAAARLAEVHLQVGVGGLLQALGHDAGVLHAAVAAVAAAAPAIAPARQPRHGGQLGYLHNNMHIEGVINRGRAALRCASTKGTLVHKRSDDVLEGKRKKGVRVRGWQKIPYHPASRVKGVE